LNLTGDIKDMIRESATESMDAATLYSKALYYQDRYDYEQAYAFFKKAYETDPTFEEARRKMEIYRPLAAS
jgi:tetratricopeptide (TPR) repeat protein